jgi:hypothetical protein
MFQMRKRFLPFTLALLMLFPLLFTSCARYSTEDGSRTYALSGGTRKKHISVLENGKEIWKTSVKTKPSVRNRKDDYGLSVLDLNFDGVNDIKLIVDEENDVLTEVCYLWNPTTGAYEESEALSQIKTIGVVPEQKLVLSYRGKTFDYASMKTVETVVSYQWQDDGLIPYRKLSITYYHIQDYYCYGVADYLDGAFEFDEPSEQWLTPEEFAEKDWSFFYYFK